MDFYYVRTFLYPRILYPYRDFISEGFYVLFYTSEFRSARNYGYKRPLRKNFDKFKFATFEQVFETLRQDGGGKLLYNFIRKIILLEICPLLGKEIKRENRGLEIKNR